MGYWSQHLDQDLLACIASCFTNNAAVGCIPPWYNGGVATNPRFSNCGTYQDSHTYPSMYMNFLFSACSAPRRRGSQCRSSGIFAHTSRSPSSSHAGTQSCGSRGHDFTELNHVALVALEKVLNGRIVALPCHRVVCDGTYAAVGHVGLSSPGIVCQCS